MTFPSSIHIANTDATAAGDLSSALGAIFATQRVRDFFLGLGTTYIAKDALNGGSSFHKELDRDDLINPSVITAPDKYGFINIGNDASGQVDGITSDFNQTIELTVTHELIHALTIPSFPDPIVGRDNQFAEQIAVFGANAVYGKLAGVPERIGHYSPGAVAGGVSQVAYISANDSISFSWSGMNAVFSTADGAAINAATGATTERTYWRNILFDEVVVRNYITVERNTAATGPSVLGPGADAMMASLISQSVVNGGLPMLTSVYNLAANVRTIAQSLSSDFNNLTISQHRAILVANERFADEAVEGTTRGAVNAIGPANDANGQPLERFFIIDVSSSNDTLMLGGGSGVMGDMLKAGGGNDILKIGGGSSAAHINEAWGGVGDDILIGGRFSDLLEGGENDDVLIGSGGSDTLSGGNGTDLAYFGDLPAGILVLSGEVMHLSVSDPWIATLNSIEAIYGTPFSDTIYGEGFQFVQGGGGDDVYFAYDGAARYLDSAPYQTFTNTMSFERLSSSVDITMSGSNRSGQTTGGTYYEGMAKVHGTEHADIFRLESTLIGNTKLWGGEDADKFHVSADAVWLYGEAGADVFYIKTNGMAQTIDGGGGSDEDTLDFSQFSYSGSGTLVVNMTSATSGSWGSNSYVGIEKIEMGATAHKIVGTSSSDVLHTGSGKSIINGGGGIDYITVRPADSTTPAGLTFSDVTVDGGADQDFIVAYRSATIRGGSGDDIINAFASMTIDGGIGNDNIVGSDEVDYIIGGAGNDTIDTRGGDDVFGADGLSGIDRIDAGAGSKDIFVDGRQITGFRFSLDSADPSWFGIQLNASAVGADTMFFKNLDRLSFASQLFTVEEAVSALTLDADHVMTGSEMKAAILAARQSGSAAIFVDGDLSSAFEIGGEGGQPDETWSPTFEEMAMLTPWQLSQLSSDLFVI